MILRHCRLLTRRPMTRRWFRAVRTRHLSSALAFAHTATIPGRFNPGSSASPAFPVFYLTEDPVTALFEVRAVLGSPLSGPTIPSPARGVHWAVIQVDVTLRAVADLSPTGQRRLIRTTAQELTGDWEGYRARWVSRPGRTGHWPDAPTQKLGAALHAVRGLEGFVTYSARNPTKKNLIVFPDKLRKGSRLVFTDTTTGAREEVAG